MFKDALLGDSGYSLLTFQMCPFLRCKSGRSARRKRGLKPPEADPYMTDITEDRDVTDG
jgi:hypothetical protein